MSSWDDRGRRLVIALAIALVGSMPTAAAGQELPSLSDQKSEAELREAPPGSIPAEAAPGDDRAIEKRLREVFDAVEGLEDVAVDVRSGVVALSGQVLTNRDAERAASVARQIRGVIAVESEIEIARDLDRRLRPALEALRERAASLIGLVPLLGIALAVVAIFLGLAWLATAPERLYGRFVHNPFARDLLRQAVRLAIASCGVLIALEILDATAVVAAAAGIAGIAGLAISFAFRDLAENYIASVLLSLRQPFLPDDHVVIEGSGEGRVVRLTSRATVLIDFDGNHVRIPNSTVFKSVIRNYTRNPTRRFGFAVGVSPDTDLAEALELGVSTLSRLPGTLDDPPAHGWIEQLGDWTVVIRFYAWIDQRKVDWFRTRSEGIRVVVEAFEATCIAMPAPTLVLRPAPTDEERARDRRTPPPEPALELDISPDSHLHRAVARDRADVEDDLLDPAAPRE